MEGRRQRRQSPELPWDAWVNILSRLPMILILQLRSVCKGWRLLLAHPHFTEVHSQKLEQYPALLYFNYSTRCLTHVELIGDGGAGAGDTTPTTNDTSNSSASTAVMKLKVVEDYALNPVATCNGVVCFSCRSDRFAGNTPYYVGNPLVDRVQDLARVEELTRNPDEASCIRGFGLSLKTKRYKIVGLYYPPAQYSSVKVGDHHRIHVKICTISPRWKSQDNWRDLGPFPLGGRRPLNPSRMIGSYLDGGIHWVLQFCDRHPALISRLDLDSEQFEWLPTPESDDFQSTKEILSLGTSGGHLILCTDWSMDCCRTTGAYTTSIWVRMKESWTKNFVVKRPTERIGSWQLIEDVRVLNYVPQVDEAAGRREAAEVVLLYCSRSERIFACTSTLGHYVPGCRYVPSLLSIYDA